MRSFHLFVAMLTLLVFSPANSANSSVIPNDFFTVVLSYDESSETSSLGPKARLNSYAQQGMTVLLMRLTGQPQLLESKLGSSYVQQAKKWLASYYIQPRMEDGVTVGQNIALRFDASRLKQAFKSQSINLLTAQQRPATLVMGTFVQQGRLEKLTQEILGYRVDVEFRDYPQSLRLPILVPESKRGWIFPVDASNNLSKVQETIIRHNQKNLLSFKMLAKNSGQYELSWMLFSINGSTLKQGKETAMNRQQLFSNMFNEVMQRYAKMTAVKVLEKNRVTLKVHQVAFGEQVKALEQELIAQQPLISKVNLISLQAGMVEFEVDFQGEFSALLNWLKTWQKVQLTDETEAPSVIEMNVRYQLFQPELQAPAQLNRSNGMNNKPSVKPLASAAIMQPTTNKEN